MIEEPKGEETRDSRIAALVARVTGVSSEVAERCMFEAKRLTLKVEAIAVSTHTGFWS